MRLLAIGLCLVLGGTVACGDDKPRNSSQARAPTKAPPPGTPLPEITQGTGVHLRGELNASAQVAVTVANAGSAPVQLSTKLVVEKQTGAEWAEVEDTELSIRSDCQTQAPDCMTLVPGAELFPPAWLAASGTAQCACADCVAAPAGTYRFVAHSCDGEREYRGTPFTLRR